MSPVARLKYLAVNALRNSRGIWTRGGAERPHVLRGVNCQGQSPSRLLIESFIASELPQLLPPGQISVIEIGCGSGSMTCRLAGLGYRGSYVGVDVQNRFTIDASGVFEAAFQQMDIHHFTPNVLADLIVSVSALEHIPDDVRLLERVRQWGKPGAVELHAVPAAAALLAYLWHGYRQYTVASLRERFGDEARVVPLGGLGTLLVHMVAITIPEVLLGLCVRSRLPRLYARLVQAGSAVDRVIPIGATAHIVIRKH